MPHSPLPPVANPTVVLREEFDDWAVLYNPDTAEAFGTNPVGVAIWKLVNGRRDADQIAAAVAAQFEEAPETVEADVGQFLAQLSEHGFVGYETAD